ncbi:MULTISPECIES: hypothetical protein [Salinibaculum]|uniref:hypothetical protein n=1 Tax=Salinibaculum TaxID=2732368 RepID=UPI0030D577B2
MKLRRRTFLVALAGTAASAGCTGAADQPQDERPTETQTPAPTEDPKADTPEDRFADEPCPSFTQTDRTVCWHSREDGDVFLEPSAEVLRVGDGDDTVETVTFTLHNDADRAFKLNPHAWAVKEKLDGEWTHVAPDAHVEPQMEVPAGKTYEWVLSRQTHSSPMAERTLAVTADVTPGVHAFAVHGWYGDGDDAEDVECIALFEVEDVVTE